MNFKMWIEESSLGSGTPEMGAMNFPNRGSDTPASDEVKRTGMQPQVDGQEVHTRQKDEQDKLQAVDAGIERLDTEIPEGSEEEFPKINKFRKLWKELKEKWDAIKVGQDEPQAPDEPGLGFDAGDQKYVDTMRQYPNMVPAADKTPHGPGIFGQS